MRLLGSGTGATVGAIVRKKGSCSPEISEAFTVAPNVVNSPAVLVPTFEINRFEPDKAIPKGAPGIAINDGFTGAPEVVYSPMMAKELLTTNLMVFSAHNAFALPPSPLTLARSA